MGADNVTDLAAYRRLGRARRPPGAAMQAEFYFDLRSPFTYFAAERVQRTFAQVTWIPALMHVRPHDDPAFACERAPAVARAAALRLPLAWPERWPQPVPAGMRAASYAASEGRIAEFVVAACRLAWAGGFDLQDPQVLAEAAAAASLAPEMVVRAARDPGHDAGIEAAGHRIAAAGADRLPAILVGRELFVGEERLAEAAAYSRSSSAEGA